MRNPERAVMPRLDSKTGKTVYSIRLDDQDRDKLLWLCRQLNVPVADIFRYLVREKAEKLGFNNGR